MVARGGVRRSDALRERAFKSLVEPVRICENSLPFALKKFSPICAHLCERSESVKIYVSIRAAKIPNLFFPPSGFVKIRFIRGQNDPAKRLEPRMERILRMSGGRFGLPYYPEISGQRDSVLDLLGGYWQV